MKEVQDEYNDVYFVTSTQARMWRVCQKLICCFTTYTSDACRMRVTSPSRYSSLFQGSWKILGKGKISNFFNESFGKCVWKITDLSLNAGDPVDAEPGADQRHQGLWGVEGHLHAVGTTGRISPLRIKTEDLNIFEKFRSLELFGYIQCYWMSYVPDSTPSLSKLCSLPNPCPVSTRELPDETLRLHTCEQCPKNYPWILDPTGDGFAFKGWRWGHCRSKRTFDRLTRALNAALCSVALVVPAILCAKSRNTIQPKIRENEATSPNTDIKGRGLLLCCCLVEPGALRCARWLSWPFKTCRLWIRHIEIATWIQS